MRAHAEGMLQVIVPSYLFRLFTFSNAIQWPALFSFVAFRDQLLPVAPAQNTGRITSFNYVAKQVNTAAFHARHSLKQTFRMQLCAAIAGAHCVGCHSQHTRRHFEYVFCLCVAFHAGRCTRRRNNDGSRRSSSSQGSLSKVGIPRFSFMRPDCRCCRVVSR